MNEAPNSPASESALIAAMVDAPAAAIAKALECGVTASTFYDTKRARMFAGILQLHAEGLEPTQDRLFERVVKAGDGYVTINDLLEATSKPTLTVSAVCEELRRLEMRRDVMRHADALKESASSNPDALGETIMRILATQTQSKVVRSWAQIIGAAEVRADAAIAGSADPDARSLTLGFGPGLDRILKRFRRKELVIIAARPSVGKSSLMRHICHKNACAGANVVMQSLEVSVDEVADQMAASVANVSWYDLPRAGIADRNDYKRALAALKKLPIHLFDCDPSLAAIMARAKAIHSQKPIDLLAVDYLGLVKDCTPAKGQTVAQAVGTVTKAMKRLAMELDCVILLLAQLNRESAKANREPNLTDLRDSGDIEQDADRVIFIHRPDSDPIRNISQGTTQDAHALPRFYVQLLQEKGRNVGTAQGALWFHRQFARFELIAPETKAVAA